MEQLAELVIGILIVTFWIVVMIVRRFGKHTTQIIAATIAYLIWDSHKNDRR